MAAGFRGGQDWRGCLGLKACVGRVTSPIMAVGRVCSGRWVARVFVLRFKFNIEVFIFVSLRRVSNRAVEVWAGLSSMCAEEPLSRIVCAAAPTLFPSSVP